MFLKTNLGFLSQIALKNMQLLAQMNYKKWNNTSDNSEL